MDNQERVCHINNTVKLESFNNCEFSKFLHYDLKVKEEDSFSDCELIQTTLTNHLRRYASAKPFTCAVCNYKCLQKQQLIYHLRTHTGEKPFTCEVCDKKFSEKGILTIHLRTHTGERPFACDVCDKKFSQKQSLKKHSRTHTVQEL